MRDDITNMGNYVTNYPSSVMLQNDPNQYDLTMEDNKERILIVETATNLDQLKGIFKSEGFNGTSIEIKKPGQIGDGMLKNLSEEWDMHIRFLQLNEGRIAIDGEVETSRKWVEHNTADNWISVIYEITSVLQKYRIQFGIWHKKMRNYVINIMREMQIEMPHIGKIKWKDVAVVAGIVIVGGLITWAIKKYLDSKK